MPGRTYLTLPPGVDIVPSKIEGAGLGVVSKIFLSKYTWFSEYEGFTVDNNEEDYIRDYACKDSKYRKTFLIFVSFFFFFWTSYIFFLDFHGKEGQVPLIQKRSQ